MLEISSSGGWSIVARRIIENCVSVIIAWLYTLEEVLESRGIY